MYDRTVEDDDVLHWPASSCGPIATPGHTLDHISYWLPEEKVAFVADTVFALGCGRVIEGTHEMMWNSIDRLRRLPEDTALYCGHEYTLATQVRGHRRSRQPPARRASREVQQLRDAVSRLADDRCPRESDQPVSAGRHPRRGRRCRAWQGRIRRASSPRSAVARTGSSLESRRGFRPALGLARGQRAAEVTARVRLGSPERTETRSPGRPAPLPR
jgi:hypothetical protein